MKHGNFLGSFAHELKLSLSPLPCLPHNSPPIFEQSIILNSVPNCKPCKQTTLCCDILVQNKEPRYQRKFEDHLSVEVLLVFERLPGWWWQGWWWTGWWWTDATTRIRNIVVRTYWTMPSLASIFNNSFYVVCSNNQWRMVQVQQFCVIQFCSSETPN